MDKTIELLRNSLFDEKFTEDNISLMTGRSGLMLTSFICGDVLEDRQLTELGQKQVLKVVDLLSTRDNSSTYCSGVAGCGWAINFLEKNNLLEHPADSLLNHLDEIIEEDILKKIRNKSTYLDFFHGLIGMGFYLLDRDKHFDTCLTELVSHVLSTKINYGEHEVYWEMRTSKNTTVIDFGMAHGLSSIVNFLMFFQAKNPTYRTKEIQNVILQTLNFIEIFKSDSGVSVFPGYLNEELKGKHNSRLAWCRGDLNIAYSFLLYGRNYNSSYHENLALEIFNNSAPRRKSDQTGIKDKSFCHGNAGILYMYNQLSTQYGIDSYTEAADYWYKETIGSSSKSATIEEFKYWSSGNMLFNSSIIFGTSGILLSILDYLKLNKKYNFQNMFLLGA